MVGEQVQTAIFRSLARAQPRCSHNSQLYVNARVKYIRRHLVWRTSTPIYVPQPLSRNANWFTTTRPFNLITLFTFRTIISIIIDQDNPWLASMLFKEVYIGDNVINTRENNMQTVTCSRLSLSHLVDWVYQSLLSATI